MTPQDREREAQIVHVIARGPSLAKLAEFAVKRQGFGDSDGGFGVIYAGDLDERENQRRPIPPEYVEVYGYWGAAKGGFEFLVTEREYLSVLARSLRGDGQLAEATAVERLIA